MKVVSRHFVSLVLALLLIAAPVSVQICEATCAGHTHGRAPGAFGVTSHHHDVSAIGHEHAAHRHYDDAKTQGDSHRLRFTALARACGHDVATIVRAVDERGTVTFGTLSVWSLVALTDTSLKSSIANLNEGQSPPDPVRSVSPLRI